MIYAALILLGIYLALPWIDRITAAALKRAREWQRQNHW